MKIKFTTPQKLGVTEKTKTKIVAIFYEDDDIGKKYPSYDPLPPNMDRDEYYFHHQADTDKESCFVVLKNSDFTEGRGPMVVDKIFKSIVSAEEYVSAQSGIYGSKQYRSTHFGVNINGVFYAITSHNGYEIKKLDILP